MVNTLLDENSGYSTLNLYAIIILVIFNFIYILLYKIIKYSRKIIYTYTLNN